MSAPKLPSRYLVNLNAEHYSRNDRFKLFENRRLGLPHGPQRLALRNQAEAVDRLTTPFEMQRYFDLLLDGSPALPQQKCYRLG